MRGGLVTPFHSNLNSPARCNGSLYSVHLSGPTSRQPRAPTLSQRHGSFGFRVFDPVSHRRSVRPPVSSAPRRAAPRRATLRRSMLRRAIPTRRLLLRVRRSRHDARCLTIALLLTCIDHMSSCRMRAACACQHCTRLRRACAASACTVSACLLSTDTQLTPKKMALVHVTSSRLAHAPVFASRSFTQEQSES